MRRVFFYTFFILMSLRPNASTDVAGGAGDSASTCPVVDVVVSGTILVFST